MTRNEVNLTCRQWTCLASYEPVQGRFWYSVEEHSDGMVDYEFYDMAEVVQRGTCAEDEIVERFNRLTKSALH